MPRAKAKPKAPDFHSMSVHPIEWEESALSEGMISLLGPYGEPVVVPVGSQITAEVTGVYGEPQSDGMHLVRAVRVKLYRWRPADSPQLAFWHRFLARFRRGD